MSGDLTSNDDNVFTPLTRTSPGQSTVPVSRSLTPTERVPVQTGRSTSITNSCVQTSPKLSDTQVGE